MRAIREVHENKSLGHGIGEEITPLGDTVLGEDATLADVYRSCVGEEYGRCVSKVWKDLFTGQAEHIGYYFERRARYEDVDETYLHGTWVIVGELVPARAAAVV